MNDLWVCNHPDGYCAWCLTLARLLGDHELRVQIGRLIETRQMLGGAA